MVTHTCIREVKSVQGREAEAERERKRRRERRWFFHTWGSPSIKRMWVWWKLILSCALTRGVSANLKLLEIVANEELRFMQVCLCFCFSWKILLGTYYSRMMVQTNTSQWRCRRNSNRMSVQISSLKAAMFLLFLDIFGLIFGIIVGLFYVILLVLSIL